MIDPVVAEHFKEMFSGPERNRNLGKISDPDAMADAEGCRGGRDHLFVHLDIHDSRIVDIRFECATCDPAMLVTASILCDLARGRELRDALMLSQADFFEVLGTKSEDIAEHSIPALDVLRRAIDDYHKGQGTALDGEYSRTGQDA